MSNTEHIDFSTLTWVKGELDETLDRAKSALEEFVENAEDTNQIQQCANYLHQVQGTLKMVELYGAAMVAEEMELVANDLADGKIHDQDSAFDVLMRSILQLPDYLERIELGHKDVPMVLLPLVNDLRAVRTEKLLSESALFNPDLKLGAPQRIHDADAAVSDTQLKTLLTKIRSAFQLSLLKWIKGQNQALNNLHVLVEKLQNILPQEEFKQLFWSFTGLLEGLKTGSIKDTVAIKQLAGKADPIIRSIVPNEKKARSAARGLTKNFLYYIAISEGNSQIINEIKDFFNLNQFIPDEEEIKHAKGSLTGKNKDLLQTVADAINDDVLIVQESLDLFIRNRKAEVSDLQPMVNTLDKISDTLGILGLGVSRDSIMRYQSILSESIEGNQRPTDEDLLEVAKTLLVIESQLNDHIQSLGLEVHEPAETDSSGITVSPSERNQILRELANESIINLQQIKNNFVAYIEAPWDREQILVNPKLLNEIAGALKILNLKKSADQIDRIAEYTNSYMLQTGARPSANELDRLANVISSIEYYLENLDQNTPGKEQILDQVEQQIDQLMDKVKQRAEDQPPVEEKPVSTQIELEEGDLESVDLSEYAEQPIEAESDSADETADPLDFDESELEDFELELDDLSDEESELMDDLEVPEEAEETVAEPVAAVEAAAPVELPLMTFDGDVDDEIKEVFIEEFSEEMGNLADIFAEWKKDPEENQDRLTEIRRIYHTLKGSGRLVGAEYVGDYSWEFENMCNRVLDGSNVPTAKFIESLEASIKHMPEMLEGQKSAGAVPVDYYEVMTNAKHVAEGNDDKAVFGLAVAAANEAEAVSVETETVAVEEESTAETVAEEVQEAVAEDVSTEAVDTEEALALEPLEEDSEDEDLTLEFEALDELEAIEESAAEESLEDVTSEDTDADTSELTLEEETLELGDLDLEFDLDDSEEETADEGIEFSLEDNESASEDEVAEEPALEDVEATEDSEELTLELDMGDDDDSVPELEEMIDLDLSFDSEDEDGEIALDDITLEEPETTDASSEAAEAETSENDALSLGDDLSLELEDLAVDTAETDASELELSLDLEDVNTESTDDEETLEDGLELEEIAEETSEETDEFEVEVETEASDAIEESEPVEETDQPEEAEVEALELAATADEIEEDEESDGRLTIDPVFVEILQKEVGGHLDAIQAFAEQPSAKVTDDFIRVAHTLNGAASMASVDSITSMTSPLERYAKLLKHANQSMTDDDQEQLQLLVSTSREAMAALGTEKNVDTGDIALYFQEQLRISELQGVSAPAGDSEEIEEVTEESANEETTEEVVAEEPMEPMLEIVPDEPVEAPAETAQAVQGLEDLDEELLGIFSEEAHDIFDRADHLLADLEDEPDNMTHVQALQRDLHTLKGGARMAGLTKIGDLGHQLESLFESIAHKKEAISEPRLETISSIMHKLHDMVNAADYGQNEDLESENQALARLISEEGVEVAAESELDKGGFFDPVSAEAPVVEELPEVETKREKKAEEAPARKRANVLSGGQIKVNSELLDRLVNFAGEVSIYRSRMEQQGSELKGNIEELANTVDRLRRQLRDLELETEAQIISNYQGEDITEGFDPLELDQFSTIQQLSRSLSESVSDLTNIQTYLQESVRTTETLMTQQSRVNTELQEGLMETRLVTFNSMVPRLRRVLRTSAQELDKKAKLVVNGAEGEMDKTVLEGIQAPLEHMIRNSMVHGIEKNRERAKKPEQGTITIDLNREATEVVIRVRDDGQGIDLKKVRKKALEKDLIKKNQRISEYDLSQMILHSGLSTASTVSKLAGRGVGMDVVNSEIKRLGGSLEIISTQGEGTEFVIRLPYTLALTQAIIVQVADKQYAIPASGVEGVIRMNYEEYLKRVENQDFDYDYAGENYQLHELNKLLAVDSEPFVENNQIPLVMIRSGDQGVALRVDQTFGGREIVVKSVGVQVASVPGIFGATILGDGSVVLILDIIPMSRSYMKKLAETDSEQDQITLMREEDLVKTVMIVDDSITMRRAGERMLSRNDFEVTTAKDGVDALAKLQETIPDVMLLDIEMPRMDGYELATQMKATDRFKDIPIIMITSRTGQKHKDRAKEIGVERYLGKPYQETELLNTISELIEDEE